MDTDTADLLRRHPVPRHRLTRATYHRLAETGILGEDDRVELLEGQLVDMAPIGPRHALAVDALTEALVPAVAGRGASVRVQNPIALDDRSEPQPDIAVVRRPWAGYPAAHPGAGDVLLLVEVADTSFEVDHGAKLALYARAGVAEFWIVDLTTNSVVVCREPRGERYATVRRVAADGVLTVAGLPGVVVPVRALVG